jgi:predicted amidohydrolase
MKVIAYQAPLLAAGSLEAMHEARATDLATAIESRVWVIRADVAGENDELMSYGSSGIVDRDGKVVHEANLKKADLLVADVVV